MRAFFILLLLLNAGVLVFLTLPASDAPEPYPPRPAGNGLTIVDEDAALRAAEQEAREEPPELEEPSPPRETSSTEDAASTDVEPRDSVRGGQSEPDDVEPDDGLEGGETCLLAVSEDEDAAAELAARIEADDGPTARPVAEEKQERVGYWVYIPSHDTMEAAQETMSQLADQGVDDYGYVGGERYEHAVSLGVFTSDERAEHRQSEVEALGFETEVGERNSVVTRHGVVARTAAPDTLPADEDWEEVDCDEYQA